MRREASDGRGTQNAGLGRPAAARADAAPPQHGSRSAITVTAPAGWRTQVPTTAPDAPRADTVATPNSAGGGTFCVWEPYLPCTPPGHLRPGGVRVRRQARLHGHRRHGVRDGVVRLPGDPQPFLLHAPPRLRSRSASAPRHRRRTHGPPANGRGRPRRSTGHDGTPHAKDGDAPLERTGAGPILSCGRVGRRDRPARRTPSHVPSHGARPILPL